MQIFNPQWMICKANRACLHLIRKIQVKLNLYFLITQANHHRTTRNKGEIYLFLPRIWIDHCMYCDRSINNNSPSMPMTCLRLSVSQNNVRSFLLLVLLLWFFFDCDKSCLEEMISFLVLSTGTQLESKRDYWWDILSKKWYKKTW